MVWRRRQEEVARELLRDGRAALHGFAGAQVGEDRAQHRHAVDALVLVEAPVLDREEGLRHVVGQVGEARAVAVIGPAHAEDLALGVDEHHRLLAVERPERFGVRHARQAPIDPEPERQHHEQQHDARRDAGDCAPGRRGARRSIWLNCCLRSGRAQLRPVDAAAKIWPVGRTKRVSGRGCPIEVWPNSGQGNADSAPCVSMLRRTAMHGFDAAFRKINPTEPVSG